MPKIELDHLVKDFGKGCIAANELTLEVEDGEYLCILGPTGSGKTTCLRMICGLTKPDSGRILFDGADIDDMPVNERQATMLSQTYALFPSKTVYENVMFSPEIKKWPEESSKQLVKSMIKMVHMEHKVQSYPCELSGGQQQRTALARGLASDSKILLLDEPLRALDARLRLELRKELRSLVKEMGLTAIHVTHDQDEALEMADRIAVIREGRIVQVGTPMDVFQNPDTPFVANFVGRSNIFEGTVEASCDSHSDIRLRNGGSIKARATDMPIGTDVVVAVKIGSTNIDHVIPPEYRTDGCVDEGFFQGKVERVLYEGATVTVEMDAEGIGRVNSRLPNRKYEEYSKGDSVYVSWIPSKAVVFETPPEGLEDELRLD